MQRRVNSWPAQGCVQHACISRKKGQGPRPHLEDGAVGDVAIPGCDQVKLPSHCQGLLRQAQLHSTHVQASGHAWQADACARALPPAGCKSDGIGCTFAAAADVTHSAGCLTSMGAGRTQLALKQWTVLPGLWRYNSRNCPSCRQPTPGTQKLPGTTAVQAIIIWQLPVCD